MNFFLKNCYFIERKKKVDEINRFANITLSISKDKLPFSCFHDKIIDNTIVYVRITLSVSYVDRYLIIGQRKFIRCQSSRDRNSRSITNTFVAARNSSSQFVLFRLFPFLIATVRSYSSLFVITRYYSTLDTVAIIRRHTYVTFVKYFHLNLVKISFKSNISSSI